MIYLIINATAPEQTDDHGFRKYKNLLPQNHHQTHLHLGNNPYPAGLG